jgi:hypothetical protein
MADPAREWFGIRCLFEVDPEARSDGEPRVFEERLTLWQASSVDEAVDLAEADALDYANTLDAQYLGMR